MPMNGLTNQSVQRHGCTAARRAAGKPIVARPQGFVRAAQQPVKMLLPDKDASAYFAKDTRPIILFDGVCNLCNGGVNLMLDLDRRGAFRFAALQSAAGRSLLERCGRHPSDISSIVLVQPDGCFIKSEAVLRIAAGLQLPFPLIAAAGFPFPLFFRDFVYDTVADNRYMLLGKQSECRLSDSRFAERFLFE